MTWMQTYDGRRVDIVAPDFRDISLIDIAHSLSMQCRFNGHCKFFYSVAEHSMLVSDLLPERLKLEGLLHDAAEAYLGDVIRPVKQYIERDYTSLEDTFLECVYKKFSVSLSMNDQDRIKIADAKVLRAEATQVFHGAPVLNWHKKLPHSNREIIVRFLPPEEAKRRFLNRAGELMWGVENDSTEK